MKHNKIITLKNKVKNWMKQNYDHHIDHMTGEINSTSLAEEAADMHDLYEDHVDWNIPEEVFEWSQEVASSIDG